MDDYSNSATLQLVSLGGRFGGWVRNCLAAFIEDIAGSAAEASGSRVTLHFGDDRAEILDREKSGKRQVLARLEGGPGDIASAIRRELKGRRRKDLLLRVGSGKSVVKQIVLPAGALDVLPAVVRNKVESLAPWPLHEVMWGYRVAGPPQSGQIAVDVGILSRKTLDGLLAIVQQGGAKAGRLEIGNPADGSPGIVIDFQGAGRVNRARRVVAGLMLAAASVALAIAGYGLYLAVLAHDDLVAVDQRATTLKQALRGERGGAGENLRLREANKLFDRKRDGRPLVVVLNTLTKLVPDGTWLDSVNYAGDHLTINGRGAEIPRVIEILEKSDTFADVNFSAATQRDANLNADIFAISAAIQVPGEKP